MVAGVRDTTPLKRALRREGFSVHLIHNGFSAREQRYSCLVRALAGHRKAWEFCAGQEGLSMVVEDDFVPVVGMGGLSLPFDPADAASAWGWLYAGSPRLQHVNHEGRACGGCAAPVATIVGPRLAGELRRFADQLLGEIDCFQPYAWDAVVVERMAAAGFTSFLPYRNYGEHGGLPNPEHAMSGLRPTHRADALYGPLHFVPEYAQGGWFRYLKERARGRVTGWGRLLLGVYLSPGTLARLGSAREALRYLWFSTSRLISVH